LYITNEVGKYKEWNSGAITGFSIDSQSGRLTFLNDKPSGGGNPTYAVVDQTGKYVVVANYYEGGKVAALPILKDGHLGDVASFALGSGSSVDPKRQEGPHLHSVYLSPDNRFVVAVDLGLDKLRVYRFDSSKGLLELNTRPFGEVEPGSGPRHAAYSPSGK